MDFLDPRKKRAYRHRLMAGYFLVTIAIILVTYLFSVYLSGNSYDSKTHSIVQTGLLFVGSQPSGADITLNNVTNGTTSARLVPPAGDYTLKLTKSGYRSWQRAVEVDPGTVDYYVYPFLFPIKPVDTLMQTYTAMPSLVTQTPNYHWLLLQAPSTDNNTLNFDEYDTTKPAKPTQEPQLLSLPDNLLTSPDDPTATFTMVEWSTDNNHVLLQHTYQGGSEFIVFDRANPSDSFNVNKMFGINPDQVALRNKTVDQLYIYDKSDQTLQVGDTTKPALDPVFLKHVLAFKAYGTSLLTYVTDSNMPAGKVQARIWDNGTTYPLYNFSAGSHYLIDAAQYAGHWFYIAGSDTDNRVNIFEDPLNTLQDKSIDKAYPTIAMRVLGASKVSFSSNARFVEIENGPTVGVYDFETMTRYQYTIKAPLAAPLQWMDGSRLIGDSNGTVFVADYDGTNQQSLAPTGLAAGGYFSANYNYLFTFEPSADGSSVHLDNVDMRAGGDLPKSVQSN